MHIVTIGHAGSSAVGLLIGNEILNIAACATFEPATRCIPTSMRALLAAGDTAMNLTRRLHDAVAANTGGMADRLRATGCLTARTQTPLLAPVPDPGMILAAGMNYRAHLAEMKSPVPSVPLSLIKSAAAIIGPGAAIVLPVSCPDMVDWEGEFSAVIGRPCHNVSEAEALEVIAGYTLINDVSARD
jgi:2-keto-4-pentenoate hydratase/2-oxohepta-3-ene-1,7-dioic acid hydratase in catechol pathway